MPSTEKYGLTWAEFDTSPKGWGFFNDTDNTWEEWENYRLLSTTDDVTLNTTAGQMYLIQIDCSEIPQFSGELTVIYNDTILEYKDFCSFTQLGIPTGEHEPATPSIVSNSGGELVLNWNQPQDGKYTAVAATIAFKAKAAGAAAIALK